MDLIIEPDCVQELMKCITQAFINNLLILNITFHTENVYPKFRNPAIPAFGVGISDAIVLSITTKKHLKSINLLETDSTSTEQDINFLMKVALEKIPPIAFAYSNLKWQLQVFRNEIKSSNYNSKWWEFRNRFEGIEAPIERTETNFDPASLYHIVNFDQFADLFLSRFLGFQIYNSLCQLDGNTDDLFKCDFYKSKQVGDKLKKVMELGNRRQWTFALKMLTDTNEIKFKPLLDYFKPLTAWLIKENEKNKN